MFAGQIQVRAGATGDHWWRRLYPASFGLAGITALIVWVAVAELLGQGRLGTVLSAGRAELAAPLLVALVVGTGICERIWPAERRPVLARGHVQDACFLALHAIVVIPLMTLLSVGAATLIGGHAHWLELQATEHWPGWLLVPLTIVAMDGANWLAHYADHRLGPLWRFHALHHSQEELSVLTSFRAHPLMHTTGFLLATIPVVALMPARPIAPVLITIYVCIGTLQHANLRWTFGPVGRVLVSPAYHRLHHAPDIQDANLGVVLTIWDVLAGCARFPSRTDGVNRTGLDGRPVPVEQEASAGPALLLVAEQLAEPFRRLTVRRDPLASRGTDASGPAAGGMLGHANAIRLCCPCRDHGDLTRAASCHAKREGVPMPYRVVVVGAGFGGIGMAIALKQAGIEDFVVLDKADDLGGTWRDNSYPGLCCDVPSQLYSYSFRPWRWSRRFPPREEILAYLHGLVAERGLGPHLRFGAGVAAADFDERHAVWNLTLDDGETLQATAVVCAVGQLGRPSLPDIAGRDEFAGPCWHSARWNHDADLAGRRVAVIGTGASAIQFVPEVAKVAGHLDVYQRTAPYVLPKADRPYGDTEQALYDRLPVVRKADRLRTFLYGEVLTSGFVLSPKLLAGPMQLWRRQLRTQIADPELRARCVPDYVMGCKRVVFSNDWYPTLARPNVELVTDRIVRIVPDGVFTADGTGRPADVIIYGTGFKAVDFLAPIQVSGLGGRRLREAWRDGAQAYLGITVSGFPNFFMLYGPNTNLGGNSIIYMLEGQVRYVLGALRALEAERLAWMDVRPEVQDAFNAWAQAASRTSVWETGCHNWYTTASGRNTNNWPDHTFMYRHRVRRFDIAAYRVMPEHAAVPGGRRATAA